MKLAPHLALLFLALTVPARAHDIEYDTGAICHTQKQAERLAMLLDGNEHTAVAMVNAEERTRARREPHHGEDRCRGVCGS